MVRKSDATITVVIPTLARDEMYLDAVESVVRQVFAPGVLTVVVDNSGERRVASHPRVQASGAKVIEPDHNMGFGAAINAGWKQFPATHLATLNDDAVARPGWLAALHRAMESSPRAGMAASKVLLPGSDRIDSMGMRITRDGSSKQRGHSLPLDADSAIAREVLCPSGSAALYRGAMLEKIGLFDEDFFLYCEDTDLGLRGRRAGWTCVYAPEAEVEHRYSASAGRSTALKAYYVERNRISLVVKNFPALHAALALASTPLRYVFHLSAARRGAGRTGEIVRSGYSRRQLAGLVARAHLDAWRDLPRLLEKRRQCRRNAKLSDREFLRVLSQHSIGLREITEL